MATFLMFGKYSPEALAKISAQRTKAAAKTIQDLGGEVVAVYATLGKHDLVCVVTLPGTAEAMKASVALCKQTGIAFTTAPAVTLDEFDRLMGD